jgi:hypothetical protein
MMGARIKNTTLEKLIFNLRCKKVLIRCNNLDPDGKLPDQTLERLRFKKEELPKFLV